MLTLQNVSKIYRLYNSPMDRLKEALSPFHGKYHKNFYALREVSFEVGKGETVGIVGRNGAGKSTLLKLITGLANPTSGHISVAGKISALLELGAGFNPEMTGLENVFLNGIINGISRNSMEAKLEEILAFADIGDFINQPVKTYSSGMQMRLAFSVATAIEPEILIIDEALSVGDFRFQAKCTKRIRNMMEQNTATLFVSHEVNTVKRLCDRALYLENGRLKAIGESGPICDMYIKDQVTTSGHFDNRNYDNQVESASNGNTETKSSDIGESHSHFTKEEAALFEKEVAYFRRGSNDATIRWVDILNTKQQRVEHMVFGHSYTVRIFFDANKDLDSLIGAFYIRDKNLIEVIGGNNLHENCEIKSLQKGRRFLLSFTFTNYLRSGHYTLYTLLVDQIPTNTFFDRIENALTITTEENSQQPPRWAIYNPPFEVSISGIEM